jgi:hypothetical protein
MYEYAAYVSDILRHTEQTIISSAKDYVWLMANQALIT